MIDPKTRSSSNRDKLDVPLWRISPVALASLCYLWPAAGAAVCCKMSPAAVVKFLACPPVVLWPSWFQNTSSSSCHGLFKSLGTTHLLSSPTAVIVTLYQHLTGVLTHIWNSYYRCSYFHRPLANVRTCNESI